MPDALRWKLRPGPRDVSEICPAGAPPEPYRPEIVAPDLACLHAPDPAHLQDQGLVRQLLWHGWAMRRAATAPVEAL